MRYRGTGVSWKVENWRMEGKSLTMGKRRCTGDPNLNYSQVTITRAALPGHSTREKLHVVDQAPDRRDDSTRSSKIMTRAQTARIECVQTSESKGKLGTESAIQMFSGRGSFMGQVQGWVSCEGNGRREKCRQDPKELLDGEQLWEEITQCSHCAGHLSCATWRSVTTS